MYFNVTQWKSSDFAVIASLFNRSDSCIFLKRGEDRNNIGGKPFVMDILLVFCALSA